MKTTIEQIEEVMIMQIRALDTKVPIEIAQALYQFKMHLINQHHNEQLHKKAERLARPNVFQRIVFWFKVEQSKK
jgi:hypothetical protein